MKAFVSMACAVMLIGPVNGAAAQGKGTPKVKTTAPGGGAATHGKSATYKPVATTSKPTASAKTTGSPKTASPKTTGSPKTTTTAHGGGHARTTETKTTGSSKATGHAKTGTTTTTTAVTTTSGTSTTGTTVPLTPVQQKLQKNTNLAAKLQSRLPAGTDLNTAAAGFRNLGQFVAAVNVSNNLGLDFTTLKTAMVTDGKSLGQAIQSQKGTTVNATEQAHRAERDADAMIRSTEKNGKKSTGHERP
jgi:hypothetical protein